ncbi:MAG: NUDIX hydrolase [Anaeroplasmataceae bacterium]|jgi:ADP-ribose pyrophosphatase|nr:NUDIX hydrolase [Anaeroplasmataceae bacterium]
MEAFVNRKIIFQGKVLRVEHDTVKCENGNLAMREIVRHPGGAAVLCITPENEVLLVKQYRYAYQEILFEIPAGKLEDQENPALTAIREFEEETGNKALDLTFLNVIYPTCGYSDEKIYLYLVTNFKKTQTHFDEDECIESTYYPLEQVLQMVQSGEIKDAKTICALQYYFLLNKREKI